jgi:cob(I)alamin adenosyltransferase
MKIYTKKGDEGTTSLLGGKRVKKHELRIESYGTVDELNAYLGFLRDQPISSAHVKMLINIQERLFAIGSSLAADPGKSNLKYPDLTAEDVELLESEMDKMDDDLPPLKNFILPGGHQAVSVCHMARCVCRRAERNVSRLAANEFVAPLILKFLNRLSDYLFVLSRKLSQEIGADEVPWKPRG